MAKEKDYYKILGVDKTSTKEEIKKAYKNLAKKYHPDLNKDAAATEKFKEINEAASVLADDEKKAQYDRYGTTAENFGRPSGFDYSDFSSFADFNFDFDEIFDSFFGGGFSGRSRGSSRGSRQRRGSDLATEVNIALEEAAEGTEKTISLKTLVKCPACEGSGAEDNAIETCEDCQGTGVIRIRQRTPFGILQTSTTCRSCHGTGQYIKHKCRECKGTGRVEKDRKIKVEIPAGIEDGNRLRIKGEGEAGLRGEPGDLYVIVHVKEHELFERRENDLYIEIPISFAKAVLGGEIEVPTLEGKTKLKIPPGTQTNTIFRIKGKGLPSLHHYGHGNEMVKVIIDVPKKLSRKQKELLEEFERESEEEESFFSRIRRRFE